MVVRDVNIGKPPAETIKVEVTIATPVINALETVTSEIENVAEELRKNRRVQEFILGQEVEEE